MRSASSSNSPALSPGSLSLPSLPNVSTDERGVSPPVDKLPVPPLSAQNAPVESPANTVAESAEGGEEDELAHSGEGDDGLDADGQPRTPGARGKGMKKGDKRARGNGDEHKSMTEAEWEQSRKANHVRFYYLSPFHFACFSRHRIDPDHLLLWLALRVYRKKSSAVVAKRSMPDSMPSRLSCPRLLLPLLAPSRVDVPRNPTSLRSSVKGSTTSRR